MKEFTYVNQNGRLHRMIIRPINNVGKYAVTIWDTMSGKFCGCNDYTAEQIASFLARCGYHIKI